MTAQTEVLDPAETGPDTTPRSSAIGGTLDRIYQAAGALAGCFMVILLLLIMAQMAARWFGITFPGSTNYAGYAMAFSTFLSLGYALDRGAHIRVSLMLSRLHRFRRWGEVWCFCIALLTAIFFARYAINANWWSYKLNDVSQGRDATPLWVPQIAMSVGAVLLVIVIVDHLIRFLTGPHAGVEPDTGWAKGTNLWPLRIFAAAVLLVVGGLGMLNLQDVLGGATTMKIIVFLAVLFLLLGTGVWVGLALLGVAWVGMALFTSRPAGQAMATVVWSDMSSWTLTALPLFIWMGEILYRTRLSDDMFKGLSPWMSRMPGGLLHTNIAGCTIFAAVSGSSAATLTTVGKMSIPELRRRGYPEFMTIGTLAGAATLGLMIPPSLVLIVYGVTINESISKLFMAGVFPGLMLAGFFMAYVAGWHFARPSQRPEDAPSMPLSQKLWNSRYLIPVLLLIISVIGSMYLGYATPTEAAAIGVIGSLILALIQGSLTPASFAEALMGAVRTSSMVMLILLGAAFLSLSMGFTGLPRSLANWIAAQDFSVYALIFALMIFYIIVGCFLDGISSVVLTMAVVQPMVDVPEFRELGFDMIWFGIFVVVVVEMAQITPPIGFNLFVLQGMTRHSMSFIVKAAVPMFLLMVLAVFVLVLLPELATWLPEQMRTRPGQ